MIKYHVYCILEALRLEWGVPSRMESEAFMQGTRPVDMANSRRGAVESNT